MVSILPTFGIQPIEPSLIGHVCDDQLVTRRDQLAFQLGYKFFMAVAVELPRPNAHPESVEIHEIDHGTPRFVAAQGLPQ